MLRSIIRQLAMRDEMSKTMSCGLAASALAAALLSFGASPAGALTRAAALTEALAATDVVLVQQQAQGRRAQQRRQARSSKGGNKLKLSDDHKQKIRQHVPAEYHQYIPGMSGGGAGGVPGTR
jgi:hypothetical protein